MSYLNSLSGNTFGKRYDLTKPEIIMGRHPECDVVLDAGAVSRQHAKLVSHEGKYLLVDLQSRNGTFLNGRLIDAPTQIQDGDLIRICDLELSYHDDPEPQALSAQGLLDASSILMVDDPTESLAGKVSSKLDVRGSTYGSQFIAPAEIKLQAMVDIMQALGRSVSVDEVLPSVLDGLFKIFVQADRGFIVLKEADGTLLPRCVKARRADQEESVRVSRTILKQIMETKEAIITLDATNDARFDMSQSVTDLRIRSMIVAPLLNVDGEPLGAVQIDTLQQRNRFEQADLEVLVAVSNQAALAIENAQLHDRMLLQKLVEQDLKLAKDVQQAFLPQKPLDLPGFEFYQFYQAANQIGGDYFDYIQLPGDRIAILVADVVGHGVAAAMFMAKLSAETRFTFARELDPAIALSKLNRRLTALGIEKMVTMCVVVLHPETGEIEIVNAGHMPPIFLDAKGNLTEPSTEESGLPLGIIDDIDYEACKVQIAPGSSFVLYTDGVFEAPDAAGAQFSINRMRSLITNGRCKPLETGKNIVHAVKQHITGLPQEDDMCLVIVGREGVGRK